MPQQPAQIYLRHGQTPFFRLPAADPIAGYVGTDAVLLGVPFDGGTTYQPGARFAPYHVRRVSALVQSFHPVHEVDVFRKLNVVDGGNIPASPFDAALTREFIQREVSAVVGVGAAPFLLGGDHSVALPSMRAAAAKHGALAVVHFDAHADTSGPEVWGDPFHHGAPLRHALTERLIETGQLHQVGLRGTWGTPEEGRFATSHGARVHTIEEVESKGIVAVMQEIRAAIGGRPTYVTFDIDVVDPAFAPGTGTPVPGGLTSREARAALRGLAGVDLVGLDLVEVSPPLDHADLTCHLAASLLFEGLALLALRRR